MRGEILEAAGRLLAELGGEDGLTIRGVARAVGIAPASIYQHFSDRAELVRGLLDHEYARLAELMRVAEESLGETDVVGRVRAQIHAYCAFAMRNPGHYRLMLANGASELEAGSRPKGPLLDVIDRLTAGFERCVEAGHELRVTPGRAAAVVFVGAHGRVALFHSALHRTGAELVEPFVDELVSLVFA
ncbi:TetR/AcrR family transcriptional regulator [Amycolatopsis eburnea]|uniref:TetR/AcrR family transcriptional regulator n=1 Tax=Amycolatopsis eburnea TaxID=2267691 RepID=A0A427T8K6_9PSEU|nr:TetR/AcrR family transcriptional regulator [Amycolatopsis eburnea]RSD16619.1 TetR/AcrR family transcriptional regulator [Amycolatopsis eburnea]